MYFFIRRIIDTIIALLALLFLWPVFIVIAIIVKIDSPGPAFFRQKRIGKDFKTFDMLKFRSMVENAQQMGTGVYSFANDPRITKVGHILRKTSLDELPQLINIIKGEMSFVGPRAPVVGHFPEYDELSDSYKRRFTVLPGITGWAQVVGRNELSWDEKVFYDNMYIDNVSKYTVFTDIKIWILTFVRVFSMSGVEEKEINLKKNQMEVK